MKILFAADMSFSFMSGYLGDENVEKSFARASEEFRKVDFSMVNLENIFGKKEDYEPIEKSGPNLISGDEFIKYIDVLNPTAVGLANNHPYDFGEKAMFHTMEMLKERGYIVCGAGKNIDEAYEGVAFEKDGVKVMIFAVCENEFGIAEKNKSGAAGYNLTRLKNKINEAKDNNYKVIVYFHGGNEKNPFPSPEKKELYRHFIDLGASAVIAMHTHCPQGFETYNDCPIIYSMGNFYFPLQRVLTPSWCLGYMTKLDISNEKTSFEIIPYKFDYEKLYILENDEKERFLKYVDELCAPIDNDDLLQEYFDAWCTMLGIKYCREALSFDEDMIEGKQGCAPLKNVVTCEAHAELVKNTMKILYEKRYESAKKYVPHIEKLMNIEL